MPIEGRGEAGTKSKWERETMENGREKAGELTQALIDGEVQSHQTHTIMVRLWRGLPPHSVQPPILPSPMPSVGP